HSGAAQFRDLNRDGVLEPYEDWRLPAPTRAADLLSRMTLAEKAGAMMHGTPPVTPNEQYDLGQVTAVILDSHVTAFITRLSVPAAELAQANNELQAIAERGRLGIPILISTDPRSHFDTVAGASVAAKGFAQWPGTLGLASIGDTALVQHFADTARQEYRSVGIHMALSPQADLATEPRWPRANGTFGEDPELVSRMVQAYVTGFQHGTQGVATDGVATVVKHWVGYGAAANGFDGHNYYGRFAKFAAGHFAEHVQPFDAAFQAGVAGVMPAYDVLLEVSLEGAPLEPVGANFNRQLLTELLRGKHGFGGLILSDWAITRDCAPSCMTGTPPQTRADIGMPWGVEKLSKLERYAKAVNAGIDQFGGVADTDVLVAAVQAGLVNEARLDASVLRILELKFRLGLFEDPFVEPRAAAATVGAPDFRRAALDAQRRSLVLLRNQRDLLPLKSGLRKVFAPEMSAGSLARHGLQQVENLASADVAIVRVGTPHEELHPGFFFGSRQQEGALDFKADGPLPALIAEASLEGVPTVVVVTLDRPAILTQLQDKVNALVGEFGASDDAVLDVLLGKARPEGRLPFELPSSMEAVEAQQPDAPHDSEKPLYPIFFGLRYR
ncbi:MAG TPA: glycoside hydrolase family 3 N-terminal domain-containing protein, partial [Steroidobacteraceae bacterium]